MTTTTPNTTMAMLSHPGRNRRSHMAAGSYNPASAVAIANHHSVVSARATSCRMTTAATTTSTARMTEKELNRTRCEVRSRWAGARHLRSPAS